MELLWYGNASKTAQKVRYPKNVVEWVPPGRRKREQSKRSWKEDTGEAMIQRGFYKDDCSLDIENARATTVTRIPLIHAHTYLVGLLISINSRDNNGCF